MTREQMLRELEQALTADPNSLTETTRLETVSTYDSVGRLSIIGLFDSTCGKVIEPEKLNKCVTVGDVLDLVKEKLV